LYKTVWMVLPNANYLMRPGYIT